MSSGSEIDIVFDTDVRTFSLLSEETLKKMVENSKYPELVRSLIEDLRAYKPSEEADKGARGHIYWSWSSK